MDPFAPTPAERRVYANRTLNLRGIRAFGYDMDYTLVQYRSDEWERAAFEHARALLVDRGWPAGDLVFNPAAFVQGLAFDLELGNLVKATRFGYVIRAQHGTRALPFDELRSTYSREYVDLGEPRWEFMNTLFSLSEASLFSQLVDLADRKALPEVVGYDDVARALTEALDRSHTQGELKARIVADPERYVELDPDLPLALLDQRHAGRTLLLITNSDWSYTKAMMSWSMDRFLPEGQTWRDLFDIVIVEARKPLFFSERFPAYRMVDEDQGLLVPHRGPLAPGDVYTGGDAHLVETSLGLSGADILYVGDHLFGDVHVSKDVLRWRTALILREVEPEIRDAAAFQPRETELSVLMAEKADVDRRLASLRLGRLRTKGGYAPGPEVGPAELERHIRETATESAALDARIRPLAREAGAMGNATWGPLMRAGSDKSLFARQVERYADVYTSRVSNLLAETPYGYLRAARSSLPHDPT
ncbi:MAG: HAD-IG family 5'-nucleotidase [Acidimicrobiia bacterium]|nr:HAD-IG family 5'-nucleotidase [Acidimicrobiia bacterium]